MGKIRLILTIIIALISTTRIYATSGEEVLRNLSAAIAELGRYEVDFKINVTNQQGSNKGSYIVDKERYILNISGLKIFGDNTTRYTVDDTNREVIIERIEPSTPMIVANPATAFLSLEDHFIAEIIEDLNDKESVTLMLKKRGETKSVEESLLSVDRISNLPRSISYSADGDIVQIIVEQIKPANQIIPSLDKIDYPKEYEVIDVR